DDRRRRQPKFVLGFVLCWRGCPAFLCLLSTFRKETPQQSELQRHPTPTAVLVRTTPATTARVAAASAAQSAARHAGHNRLRDSALAAYPAPRAPLRYVPAPPGTLRKRPGVARLWSAGRPPLPCKQSILPRPCVS